MSAPSVQITPSVKVVINYEGMDYPCTRLKLGDQIDLEEKLEMPGSKTKALMESLAKCGLPIEVLRTMDSAQLWEVTEALKPAKKK